MPPNDANGIEKSENADQTAHKGVVITVCIV